MRHPCCKSSALSNSHGQLFRALINSLVCCIRDQFDRESCSKRWTCNTGAAFGGLMDTGIIRTAWFEALSGRPKKTLG